MHSIFITADNIQPTSKMSYEKFKIFTMISYLHFTADSNFPLIMLAADATKNIADNAYIYMCDHLQFAPNYKDIYLSTSKTPFLGFSIVT